VGGGGNCLGAGPEGRGGWCVVQTQLAWDTAYYVYYRYRQKRVLFVYDCLELVLCCL
jgi:hypothetical protein